MLQKLRALWHLSNTFIMYHNLYKFIPPDYCNKTPPLNPFPTLAPPMKGKECDCCDGTSAIGRTTHGAHLQQSHIEDTARWKWRGEGSAMYFSLKLDMMRDGSTNALLALKPMCQQYNW